ncbi:hypothetical protein [Streptomyces sp. NPDC051662]
MGPALAGTLRAAARAVAHDGVGIFGAAMGTDRDVPGQGFAEEPTGQLAN